MTETKTKRAVAPIRIEQWVGTDGASRWDTPLEKELGVADWGSTEKALAAIKKHAPAGRYRIIAVKRHKVTVTTQTETVRVVT